MRDTFERIVYQRRTFKDYSGKAIAKSDLEKLLEWASRAPNHYLNQPWRFVALEQTAVNRLIQHLNESMPENDRKSCAKIFDRMSKVGAIIFVGVLSDSNPQIHEENFSAACAAVQNILLGAAAMDLGSYWSTNRAMTHDQTRSFLGWRENSIRFVAGIWLGEPASVPELSARKPLTEVCQFLC